MKGPAAVSPVMAFHARNPLILPYKRECPIREPSIVCFLHTLGCRTICQFVPDVCAEFAARASAAVRSRFVFDIFAAYQKPTRQQIKKKKKGRQIHLPRLFDSPKLARTFPVLTPIMPRPFVSSNAPTSSSASPNAIRFVSFRSSVCAYASLALRALDSG
jgi:hypothetical protein